MKKIKVLALALYGDTAASTRIRINQYKENLSSKDIDLYTTSLLDNFYLNYKKDRKIFPFFKLIFSYFKRAYFLIFKYDYDLIFLHCELFPFFPAFIERLFLQNKKYIYDFDDAFYLKYREGKYSFLKPFLGNKFDRMISHAYRVTAGSNTLFSYASALNKYTVFLPSSLDMSRVQKTNKEIKDFSRENPLILGWIGSPSTEKYLRILKEPLEELGHEIFIKLVIVGGRAGFFKNIAVEEISWSQEIENSFLNSIDVGVMPLSDDRWSQGKCGYKLIQYMGFAKPVIASRVGANKEIVNSSCGILVSDKKSWKEAILYFYNKPQALKEFGINSEKIIVNNYSISANFQKLENAIIDTYESS